MVFFVLLGLAAGSFLNVAIDRLPKGESLVSPPSHCDSCKRRLAWWENVPLISYVLLRGRCRTCGTSISIRVLLVELGTGLLFAFLWWHYDPGLQLAIAAIYTCIFLVLAVIDLEHGLLLNKIVYPSLLLALAFASFWPDLGWWRAFAGGAIGFGALLLPRLLYPKGMGLGDIKLAAFIGLVTGFPLVAMAFLLAAVGGGLVGVLLLVSRIKKRGEAIPFGPFLSAGALATLYYGQELWDIYTGWLGFT